MSAGKNHTKNRLIESSRELFTKEEVLGTF